MGTVIVGAVLFCIVIAVVKHMIRQKRSGKSIHCGGNCEYCGGGCGHHGSDEKHD